MTEYSQIARNSKARQADRRRRVRLALDSLRAGGADFFDFLSPVPRIEMVPIAEASRPEPQVDFRLRGVSSVRGFIATHRLVKYRFPAAQPQPSAEADRPQVVVDVEWKPLDHDTTAPVVPPQTWRVEVVLTGADLIRRLILTPKAPGSPTDELVAQLADVGLGSAAQLGAALYAAERFLQNVIDGEDVQLSNRDWLDKAIVYIGALSLWRTDSIAALHAKLGCESENRNFCMTALYEFGRRVGKIPNADTKSEKQKLGRRFGNLVRNGEAGSLVGDLRSHFRAALIPDIDELGFD